MTKVKERETESLIAEYQDMLRVEQIHVQLAHKAILALRAEVQTLNSVIARRKRGTRRLRAYVDAVKRLHMPLSFPQGKETLCRECQTTWPCNTQRAIEVVMMNAIDDSDKVIETGGK